MKILIPVLVYFSIAIPDLLASELPSHCKDNPGFRDKLQEIGPVVSLGASASSGLLAKSFPSLVANQMCLEKGSGFESRYSFGFGTKYSFLKNQYIEQRPKVIVATDIGNKRVRYRAIYRIKSEYISQ